MDPRSLLAASLLLLLLLPPPVSSQGFELEEALDDAQKPATPTPGPAAPGGGAAKHSTTTTTTITKAKVLPKAPTGSKAPTKPKPAGGELELKDALDPKNDIGGKDKGKSSGDVLTDQDLFDISNDDSYKPDKGKGRRPGGDSDQINQYDDNGETTAEVGTIAGIASAVAMALVGAITSYISYQKKKLCFSIQQSLNTDMVKAENPEAVVATEPQVQQTLLQSANAEPPTEENAV